jgi:Flp pilus assembly protein TadD
VSWRVVASADAAPNSYATALRQAQIACRLKADDWACLNTLGVALYRNGRFQEAMDALLRSDHIYSVTKKGHRPTDLAFLAMAQFQLGRKEKARALLNELRLLMKQPQWSGDEDELAFLREAHDLIEGKR